MMAALQETNESGRAPPGQHHCRDCGVFFESAKSLDVHVQYHKENLLTKWASQAAAAHGDSENNNVKRGSVAAPADSTDMKPVLPTGPGRPSSTSSYPPASSPFTHPHTPASYTSAPSPYQSEAQRFSPANPSSTSFGYANGTTEPYQMPFNGYPHLRSPRGQPVEFFDNAQEGYILGPNTDFPTHRAATPSSPSSSTPFRFSMFNKTCYPLDKNGVSSSSPNSFRAQSPHQCEKCGFICDSQPQLAEHVKSTHPPSPLSYGQGGSAFQAPETFYRSEVKQEVLQESPDILDLDSQQKVFREDENGSMPPSANPHSVSAMLTPWSSNIMKPYPSQPYIVSSSNPPQSYSSQNGPAPSPNFQNRSFPSSEPYPSVPQQSNVPNQSITTNQSPNATSPKISTPSNSHSNSGKGDSWKSNEARRPKTYNCSACNKWFTSSGHLKRHYNTTLHKNAVKQSGHPDPAVLPISSHHHPNRDPSYIHSSKTPPGVANPPPNISMQPKPKKAKSITAHDETSSPSPAMSNTNEGDSSRSNDNMYERMYERNGGTANGAFERPVQHGFGNGFEMLQSGQSAFDRTTPQGFEQRSTSLPENGYTIQELNRPGANSEPVSQGYDYYRYTTDNRLPLNQQNSTNQAAAQPPNFQAGPSASPSGGLPICRPSLLSLRTPNLTTTYMGENTLMRPTNEPSHPPDPHTIPHYTSSLTTTGNDELQSAPLPSFSNFQTSILPSYQQQFPDNVSYSKGYYVPGDFAYHKPEPGLDVFIKTEPMDRADFVQEYLDEQKHEAYEAKRHMEMLKLLNIKMELDSSLNEADASPGSPVQFPTSTNLELAKKPKRKKPKRKPEESSGLVTSTGSPQPAARKGVIRCEECDKCFNRICYLTQHNKSFHSGVKPYKCDRCGKRFHSELRARDHSRKHGGEKPYKCEMCPKSFNHKTDLRRHLCLHSGDKPFACEFCGKGFIRKDHMLKHCETHRNGKRKYINKVMDDVILPKDKVLVG